ncbi:hypothetical protein GQ600_9296 [Phytophthora cactorum]|nr:hypothetical protein GQ600_9296 [Phytophthora cactorum]
MLGVGQQVVGFGNCQESLGLGCGCEKFLAVCVRHICISVTMNHQQRWLSRSRHGFEDVQRAIEVLVNVEFLPAPALFLALLKLQLVKVEVNHLLSCPASQR